MLLLGSQKQKVRGPIDAPGNEHPLPSWPCQTCLRVTTRASLGPEDLYKADRQPAEWPFPMATSDSDRVTALVKALHGPRSHWERGPGSSPRTAPGQRRRAPFQPHVSPLGPHNGTEGLSSGSQHVLLSLAPSVPSALSPYVPGTQPLPVTSARDTIFAALGTRALCSHLLGFFVCLFPLPFHRRSLPVCLTALYPWRSP